jgi:hypothetical protein
MPKELPGWIRAGAPVLIVNNRDVTRAKVVRLTQTSAFVKSTEDTDKWGGRERRFHVPRWSNRPEEFGSGDGTWSGVPYLLDPESEEGQRKIQLDEEIGVRRRTLQQLTNFQNDPTRGTAEAARNALDEFIAYHLTKEALEDDK